MKLYEIREAYLNLMEMEEVDLNEYLGAIQEQAEEKIIQLGRFTKQLEAEAEAIKNEEKKLAERRKSLENKSESIKGYILSNMTLLGINEVKDATVVVKPKFNPESLIIDDESEIPDTFKKVIPESYTFDKNDIKKALKEGVEISGVHLERKQSLSIK